MIDLFHSENSMKNIPANTFFHIHKLKASLNFITCIETYILKCLTFFFAQSNSRIFRKSEFLFHEDSQDTGVWKYCSVWKYYGDCLKIDCTLRCLESSPLRRHEGGHLIGKTLTNVHKLLHTCT